MSKAKLPLETKVQALLGEKLVQLKAELDDLRVAKLTNAEGHAFKFELEGIVDAKNNDSLKLSVIQSVDLSSELKQSIEAILKRRNIDTDELFLSEFQAAAVIALKQAFRNIHKLRQQSDAVRDLPVLPPSELMSMETLRGISRADLGNLRRMFKHILLDSKLSHKQHHEYPASTKDAAKDDGASVVELGKVLNIGHAVITEQSLRGMSKTELLKLTKMSKEILVEGKNEKSRDQQIYLSDDSSDSRNSTPDKAPRRPQRVNPGPGRSSSRSRLNTIVDEEMSSPAHNDDKASTVNGAAVVSDLNQSVAQKVIAMTTMLIS